MQPDTKAMQDAIKSALVSWRESTRSRDDPPDSDRFESNEAVFEAQMALQAAIEAPIEQARGLSSALQALMPVLAAGINALVEIQRDAACVAEATALHGDLAGATYDMDARISELEDALGEIEGASELLEEGLDKMEDA